MSDGNGIGNRQSAGRDRPVVKKLSKPVESRLIFHDCRLSLTTSLTYFGRWVIKHVTQNRTYLSHPSTLSSFYQISKFHSHLESETIDWQAPASRTFCPTPACHCHTYMQAQNEATATGTRLATLGNGFVAVRCSPVRYGAVWLRSIFLGVGQEPKIPRPSRG